ncbi:MAG: Cof-type HAD-IIB family hydrolase [Gammaproteobacteria bacterium]
MIRLIGIDVDGTLVGSSGVVHPTVWAAADKARHAGIHLVLCSGRAAFGVALDYARRLDAAGWHVFQNGASIIDLHSGRSSSAEIVQGFITKLIQRARESRRILELYSDSAYVTESTADWARIHAEMLGVPFKPAPYESLGKPVVRAQWVLSASDAQKLMQAPPSEVEVAVSTSPLLPDANFVGLTRKGVSKGSALRTIAENYGIDLRDVMYVGDADNDLPALRVAGHPVAMGNGSAAVRAAARHTVGHVDEGGLAQAFELAL